MSGCPFVSVIIPCRNEAKHIGKCLASILAQDYPSGRMEILVADGMSGDGTREIIDGYAGKDARVRRFENPGKIVSPGLNLLIRQSRGEVVIRMDAHNVYPLNYISLCVKHLFGHNVDNVGGVWETLPGADTMMAKAIALALTSPFGVGNSRFRLGVKEPVLVDTVPFGCYRRDVFDRVGFFNEQLVRNQDNEFNSRLIRAGGKVLLHPDIKSGYHARPDLFLLARQHFSNGFWCIYGLQFSKEPFLLRHLVPMIFVSFLLLSFIEGEWVKIALWPGLAVFGVYWLGDLIASLTLAIRHGGRYFPFLLLVFPALHFPYGIGSLCGLFQLKVGDYFNHRSCTVKG